MPLEGVDLAVARLDAVARHQAVNAGHEHVFVMRPVIPAGGTAL
jgi:hypothetical protein